MQNFDAWATGALLILMIATLATGRYGADLVVVGTLAALLVLGVIDPASAMQGYANPGVVTVALLYVVAAGMRETGAIAMLSERVLGMPKSERSARLRLALPVAGLSAIANNTPIVATFMPVVMNVSKRTGIPAERLLMPLSFSAILGGLCTLVGTSTTILVAGKWYDYTRANPDLDLPSFGMFTVTAVGLPVAIVGVVYLLFAGNALLPKAKAGRAAPAQLREYTTAVRVETNSPIVGKTIEAAGLRHLPNLFLSRIERGERTIVAVGPSETIVANDVLVFVGVLESVVDLQAIRGLTPVGRGKEGADGYRPNLVLTEAVIAATSPLIGRTIRAAGIRARYDAVVVGVHRNGQKIDGKIGDIRLRAGDVLLLEAGPDFAETYRDSAEFYLVNALPGSAAPRHERAWMALAILGGFVLAISVPWPKFGPIDGPIHPMIAAMMAAGAMILLRCCTGPQARRSVDFQVLAVIGAAFGIGHAMQISGLAPAIAKTMVAVAEPMGPLALLAMLYALTVFFTTFITNNAAAVLMFPIAVDAATEIDANLLPFAIIVAIASSAEFSTPIGYQTNLMVAGPGGYRWMDYLRFGGPLTVISGVVAILAAWVALGL